jgi:hypothetical protein
LKIQDLAAYCAGFSEQEMPAKLAAHPRAVRAKIASSHSKIILAHAKNASTCAKIAAPRAKIAPASQNLR